MVMSKAKIPMFGKCLAKTIVASNVLPQLHG